MKLFFLSYFLICCSMFSFTQNQLVITTINYPPFYQDSTDEQGLACDLLREVLTSENIDFVFTFVPPLRMIHEIHNNVSLCGLGKKLQQANDDLIISNSLYRVNLVLIYDSRVFPEGITFSTFNDIQNLTIGVLEKNATTDLLIKNKDVIISENTSNTLIAKQLYNHLIDAWATVDISGLMTLKELFPTEYRYFKCTNPIETSEINVIIPKEMDRDNYYSLKINQGIDKLKKSNKYKEITKKYDTN